MDKARVERLVYQYLAENGHGVAAMALLEDIQQANPDATGPALAAAGATGQLQAILDAHADREARAKPRAENPIATVRQALLEKRGDGVYCEGPLATLTDHHQGNVLAGTLTSEGRLLTSSADKMLRIVQVEGLPDAARIAEGPDVATVTCRAPVLCIAVNPAGTIAVCGGMDGSTFLLDVATGNILQEGPKHRKYVVRACWAPDGSTFATASYDKTAAVWTRSTADDHVFAEREHLQMYSPVECLTMAPPAPGSSAAGSAESEAGGVELVLGQRDDCRLALHALADMSVSYINMNELGDDFVSFAPMDVATSPDATLFLVSTDKDRVLIVSREHKCLVTALYGASNDRFSNPRCCWHPSGLYAYSTSQTQRVIVWEIATGRVVQELEGHEAVIRDMSMSAAHGVLVTCSFDKSVRLWAPNC